MLEKHLNERFPIEPYPQQLQLACDIYQSLVNLTKVLTYYLKYPLLGFYF